MAGRLCTRWKRTRRRTKALVGFLAAGVVLAVIAPFGEEIYDHFFRPPYRMSVERNPDRISTRMGERAGDSAGYLVLDQTIGEIEPPPTRQDKCSNRYEWAKKQYGAVDADRTAFRITLEGLKDEQVQLYDMEVRRLAVRPPPTEGVHLACPGLGGSVDVKNVSIALDQDPPEVTVTDASEQITQLLFAVGKGESDVFDVTAFATECDCEWELTLLLRHGGKEFPERVGPLRTVSSLHLPTFHWVDGDWFNIDAEPPQPQAPPATPIGLDACKLLTRDEAAAFLGGTVGQPSVVTTYTRGAGDVPVHHSLCTFPSDRPPPPDANPSGLTDSVSIIHEVAASLDDAVRTYDGLLAEFGRGSRGEVLPGIGDVAAEFDGVVVARRGSDILQVQVSANDRELMARAGELAATVAQRLWQ
jgi:hypothetical protein